MQCFVSCLQQFFKFNVGALKREEQKRQRTKTKETKTIKKYAIAEEQLRRNMLPYNFIQNGRGSTHHHVTSLYIFLPSRVLLHTFIFIIILPTDFRFQTMCT
jgi:hypothetical protein